MLSNSVINSRERSEDLSGLSMARRVIFEGVVSGVVAGATVALWYLICDLAGGRPFHTPEMLQLIFFPGFHATPTGRFLGEAAIAFTGLHFAAFIAFGLATAAIVAASEREPLLLAAALIIYACFEVSFLSLIAFLDGSALGELGWWTIASANLLTLAMMYGFHRMRHPAIIRRFLKRWDIADAGERAAAADSRGRVAELRPANSTQR